MSRTTHLKVKVCTLACEARIIRREERKALKRKSSWHECSWAMNKVKDGSEVPLRYNLDYICLRSHRVDVVRRAARDNHLAACFFRGTPYAACENKTSCPPVFEDIFKIVKRFGTAADQQRFLEWEAAAVEHLKSQGFKERIVTVGGKGIRHFQKAA